MAIDKMSISCYNIVVRKALWQIFFEVRDYMEFESSVFEHKPQKRVEAGDEGRVRVNDDPRANEFCISGDKVLEDRKKMAEEIKNLGSAGNRKYRV